MLPERPYGSVRPEATQHTNNSLAKPRRHGDDGFQRAADGTQIGAFARVPGDPHLSAGPGT